MLPDTMPPGLMDALSGAGGDPNAPPNVIDVTHAADQGLPPDVAGPGDNPDASTPADQPQMSPADHLQAAIEHAQAALHAEPDSADSAKLAKIVQSLYAIQADQQDSHMQAMGGKPKEMRALGKAYGGPVPSDSGSPGGGAPAGGAGGLGEGA